MRAGCYIEIPRKIMLKRAVINVRPTDDACFAWAVVAALYPVEKHAERSSRYPHYSMVLNLEGVEFPMSLNGITRFERINDISINVYTVRNKKDGKGGCRIVPLRLTGDKKERHVTLLCISNTTRQGNSAHFAWIKNLSRLVGSQMKRCMHYFRMGDKLSAHSADCGRMNECAIVLPTEDDKWLKFRNYVRKERLPFVVYADLECALEKKGERKTSNTSIVQHHKVYSAGYYARCALDDASSTYRTYRGENCVSWFVREWYDLALRARTILDTDAPMTDLTPDEWERFMSATHCRVCDRPFESEDACVRDHCHLTGRYRGPAHSNCNLNYKETYRRTVTADERNVYLFHEECRGRVGQLASYLDKSELRIARSKFSDLDDADFELLARKGVFPYEYVDDVDKLRETRLPPREAFHSSQTGDAISESDYTHAIRIWERFRVEILGDYSDLYLKTDVLLLADVFKNFRDACMWSYGLDPVRYYTLPGYTWDSMLKHTGVRFELLTDIDMVMFVECGIRGGLSQCFNRYARANNKYAQSHDPSEPSYLMYSNINNN
ncbi:uncharacterized protein LOC115233720 [Formica exsecta]|uniref:uncharacterized protein LOC115233720 n=1 Tax=Formica exsecta TaxID=72781 RepID=UPI001142A096|nr:uncharacterized protein LOC115233720 [Formica exsecta]